MDSALRLTRTLVAARRSLFVAAAAAAGLLALLLGWGGALDRAIQDMRYTLRAHPASGEVHIVEIDARSLAGITRWPWPRSVHAEMVDRLHRAGARVIAFDVDFSSSSVASDDDAFAEALARAGGAVILPTLRQHEGAGRSNYIDTIPIKILTDNAFLAAVSVIPDADGYIRRMPLGVETAGVPRPSLAAMLAERSAGLGRDVEIDFAIEPATIPRHSAIDLVEGRVSDDALTGKRVVIGATAVEMGDRYAVPRHGVIPGVVIQAMAAETLLQGPLPQRWGGTLPLMLAFGLVLLGARPGSRRRRITGLALGSLGIVALPLMTESAFAMSFAIAPALAALATAAAFGMLALAAEQYLSRALHDPGTGLPNLAALEIAGAGDPKSGVVLARIDRFAAIAAGLGPAVTDLLVTRVAERLRCAFGDRLVYRVDDAAFAWFEPAADQDSLGDRIESLHVLMRAPVECGRLVDVALNVGFAASDGVGSRQRVANAGLAALHAARAGTRWERFTHADSDETNWHLSLLGELDSAMASGQVWNAYQPKLDLASGRIIGVEALVRWLHPERGPIAPDNFIPLVESHGRARDLTTHVLGQALEDCLQWQHEGFEIGVAVNVSATLLADHEFIEMVGQMLRLSPIPTDRVTIEVTESAAMASPERAVAALESWRALGISISIDDYGTGQSSLGYLQTLPASELKIDKSFVQKIGDDPRDAIMVRSTIAMAHELGLKVVAEGIEDETCLRRLVEMRCDTAQGYHIGRPVPAGELLAFLEARDKAAA